MISSLARTGIDRAVARIERRRRLVVQFTDLLGADRRPDHVCLQELRGAFVWLERAGRVATVSCDSERSLDALVVRTTARFPDVSQPGRVPQVSAAGLHLATFDRDATELERPECVVESVWRIATALPRSPALRSVSCFLTAEHRELGFVAGDRKLASYDKAALEAVFTVETRSCRRRARVAGPGLACLSEAVLRIENTLREESIETDGRRVPARAPVVLSGQAAGMFAHECIAHSLEADHFEAGWLSRTETFADALGVVDDGNLVSMSGYCPIDDEGEPARRTPLLERGRICGLLHSLETSAAMAESPTGNGRALDWRHRPIPRCSNTVVATGDLDDDALLDGITQGVYVVDAYDAAGGPNFVIGVRRARWIRHGRLGPMVQVRAIAGETRAALRAVDGVGRDTEDQFVVLTGCGKQNQGPLAVGTRAPKLRLAEASII
jgi:predicted Zn-dependent protease